MPKMSVTECVKVLEEVKSNWEGFISEYPKSIDPDAMFALNFAISALKQQEVLVKSYEDYIKLLKEEFDELVPMAHVHGWKSSRVKEGKLARKKITDVLASLGKG